MHKTIHIESRQNPVLKDAVKLRDRRHRLQQGRMLLEGFRLLEEALKAGLEPLCVFLETGKESEFERYIAPSLGETLLYLGSSRLLKDLAQTAHPQGVYGVFPLPKESVFTPDVQGLYLFLDGLQDPGNLGTIIRSAHAAGATGILLGKGTTDPFSDKVLRAAMGSFFHVPVYADGERALETLLSLGVPLAVTLLEDAENVYEATLTGGLILAIGNEGRGVGMETTQRSTLRLRIPMPGGAESLNAAVAASVILFERVRQMNAKGTR